jgi:hypothetical protein
MRHGNIGNTVSDRDEVSGGDEVTGGPEVTGGDEVGGGGGTGVPPDASVCASGHAAFVDPTASTPNHRHPERTS